MDYSQPAAERRSSAAHAAWDAGERAPSWPACVWRFLDCLNPKQTEPRLASRAPTLNAYCAPAVPTPHRDDSSSMADSSSDSGDSVAAQARHLLKVASPGTTASAGPSSSAASYVGGPEADALPQAPAGTRDAGPSLGPPWGRTSPTTGRRGGWATSGAGSSTADCGAKPHAVSSAAAAKASCGGGGGGGLSLAKLVAGGVGSDVLLGGQDSDRDECPTCLEPYTAEDPRVWTRCGHHYHLQCIYSWLERKDSCPLGCPGSLEFDLPS